MIDFILHVVFYLGAILFGLYTYFLVTAAAIQVGVGNALKLALADYFETCKSLIAESKEEEINDILTQVEKEVEAADAEYSDNDTLKKMRGYH